MLGLDRRTLQVAWTLFLFVLALATIYNVRHTVMIFTLALFFSHLLSPIVEFIERLAPRRLPRPAVLALVYVTLIAALVSALIPLGSRIAEQAAILAARLPQAIEQQDLLSRLPIPSWLDPVRPRVEQMIRDRVTDLDQHVLPMLSEAGMGILSGIGSLLSVVLIPILSFSS